MSMMAGVPIQPSSAAKLSSLANSITEKRLARGISFCKALYKITRIMSKIAKLISRFKSYIVYYVIYRFAKRGGVI